MLSRTEHAYTTGTPGTATKTDTYGYRSSGWKDQLISYNGSTIDYDDIGNPKTWRGMDLTWERGRMLMTLTKDGKTFTYTYDAGGNRVQKEVDGVTTRYFYNGNKVVGMSITNASGDVEKIHFIYDSEGNLFAMQTATGIYYYLHNLQNDIVGLIDSDGTQVVRYQYDSWGRPLDDGTTDTTGEQIGSKNPFRYREYFYDIESELYYLGSRYYDSEIGRFVNTDREISGIGDDIRGYNLFAYCFCNPINMSDPTGNWPSLSSVFKAVAVAAAVVAVAAVCVVAAPIVAGVGVASGIVATATSIAAVALSVSGASAIAAAVTSVIEKNPTQRNYNDQSVYIMRNQSDVVSYVGRSNDPDRRRKEHERDPRKSHLQPLEVKFSGLSKFEARVVEQILISAYGLENLDNARREIAVGNIGKFAKYVGNTIELFGSFYESEMLNLMGR